MSWCKEMEKECLASWERDEKAMWEHYSEAYQLRYKTLKAREKLIEKVKKNAGVDDEGLKRLNITQKIVGDRWWLDMNGMRITPILENDKILPEPTRETKIRIGPFNYIPTHVLMDQGIIIAKTRRKGFNIAPSVDLENEESTVSDSMMAMSELLRASKNEPKMKKTIKLSESEIQSGQTRFDLAESLIKELPDNHEGRNIWLVNYGKGKEAISKREKAGLRFDLETERALPIQYKKGEVVAVRDLITSAWQLKTFVKFNELGYFVDSSNTIWDHHKPLSQFNTVFSDN